MAERACWIDATSGLAGDMLMAALLDAGADRERVTAAVASLGLGVAVRVQPDRRGGFRCLRARVSVPAGPPAHRHLDDVLALVASAELDADARSYARRVFEVLAHAEGAVHGTDPTAVHFHEVGALDALADVVGCAAALDDLGLLTGHPVVTTSPLATGRGTVHTEHGPLPVPTPAVLGIAARAGLRLTEGDLEGERTTPTGAALVAALARPGAFPAMTVRGVGIGGGSRDPADRPNITRVVLGTVQETVHRPSGDVLVIEATIDDLDPQLWPSVLTAVRAAGAWDCWTSPITARHGRPGQVLTALCDDGLREAVTDTLFRHTTTVGVRWSTWQRATLPRRSVTVAIGPEGRRQHIGVKVSELGNGSRTVKPELSDVESAARALELPPRVVVDQVMTEFHRRSG
nr:nickel pincer cofactor biosynthesis protein LarC [Streptomyces sabulosicollis]